jgi:hypothetical protein
MKTVNIHPENLLLILQGCAFSNALERHVKFVIFIVTKNPYGREVGFLLSDVLESTGRLAYGF